ncbi:hypothetical protein AGMMS49545_03740 [Betaproteobacteria bacterium]|nr:hypothetical protein AGMMS49545_03740 [Betaproteobacteria bacterium]GHU41754.1 hypothetical protein AGMMS50289_05420 [Betaproteobacteria bacterium]
MRFALPSLLHPARRHARGIALFALLVICLQLATMAALDMGHQRQDASGNASLQICTVSGMSSIAPEAEQLLAPPGVPMPATGMHCPFCITPTGFFLPVIALAFPLPEAAAGVFLPATSAGFQPAAPDSRHAPKHAPPHSFA